MWNSPQTLDPQKMLRTNGHHWEEEETEEEGGREEGCTNKDSKQCQTAAAAVDCPAANTQASHG
eukprot:5607882-Pyramimonas_sp.AAC.1